MPNHREPIIYGEEQSKREEQWRRREELPRKATHSLIYVLAIVSLVFVISHYQKTLGEYIAIGINQAKETYTAVAETPTGTLRFPTQQANGYGFTGTVLIIDEEQRDAVAELKLEVPSSREQIAILPKGRYELSMEPGYECVRYNRGIAYPVTCMWTGCTAEQSNEQQIIVTKNAEVNIGCTFSIIEESVNERTNHAIIEIEGCGHACHDDEMCVRLNGEDAKCYDMHTL